MRKLTRTLSLLLALALLLSAVPALAAEDAAPTPTPAPWVSTSELPTPAPWVSVADATPEASPEATPAPTAEQPDAKPTAKPDATAKPEEAPASTPKPNAEAPWFNNSAIIGDSISDGLRLYAAHKRHDDPAFLGNLQFFTVTAYSLTYAASDNPKKLVKYKGKAMRPEDALQAMGAKKAFIMLGINDIFHTTQDNEKKYAKLIGNIQSKNPGIELGLIAMTPIVQDGQYSSFKNSRVVEYNEMVRQLAGSKKCRYIDFNDKLSDADGALKPEYSRDGFVHLKGKAFEIYAAALESAAKNMK